MKREIRAHPARAREGQARRVSRATRRACSRSGPRTSPTRRCARAAENVRFQARPRRPLPRRARAIRDVASVRREGARRARRARAARRAAARRVVLQPEGLLARRRGGHVAVHALDRAASTCASTTWSTSGSTPTRRATPPRGCSRATTRSRAAGRSRSPPTTTARAGCSAPRARSAPATSARSCGATAAASFGFASRNFYASFLAASRIDREPSRYFGAITLDSPTTYTEIELPWYTPAPALARALGVDLERARRSTTPRCARRCGQGSKHLPRDYSLRLPAGRAHAARGRAARGGAGVGAARRAAPRPLPQGPARRDALADREPLRRPRDRAGRGQQPAQPQPPQRGPGARAARPRRRSREVREVAARAPEAQPRVAPVAAAKPQRAADGSTACAAATRSRSIAKRFGTTERDLARAQRPAQPPPALGGPAPARAGCEVVEVASAESAVADVPPAARRRR